MDAEHKANISIVSPDPTVNWSNATSVPVTFAWTWQGTLFYRYTYSVDKWTTHITWWTSYTLNSNQFDYGLAEWSYTFTVNMYDSTHDSPIKTESKTFSVIITNDNEKTGAIEILSPANTVSQKEITFSRSGFVPNEHYGYTYDFVSYVYSVKKNGNTITWWTITNQNTKSFTLKDLADGQYTFDVILNYTVTHDSSTKSKAVSATIRSFTMRAEQKPSISITKPDALYTWMNTWAVKVNFAWNWWGTLFDRYEYTVRKSNSSTPETWWTVRTNNWQFDLNLPDGSYVFEVMMYDSTHSTQPLTGLSKNFAVDISSTAWAYLNILSPNNLKSYTWVFQTLVPISFIWNWWWTSLISKYNYSLVNTVTGNPVTGWTVNSSVNSIPDISLPSGSYRFDVTMLFSDNSPIIPTVSHTFNVVIPSRLNIITPSQNASFNGQQNINFSWSWFAEFANNYHYEWYLKKTKDGTVSTETWSTSSMTNMWVESFQRTLSNGLYDFTVRMMDGNTEVLSKSSSFTILDSIDLQVYVSDWNSSVTTLKSSTGTFVWNWESEDFNKYVYTIFGLSSGSTFAYSWESFSKTWSVTLTDLSSWRYRFEVTMLRSDNSVITWRYVDFDVEKPAWIKITSPLSWATITSSSATFQWTWYNDVITRYEFNLVKAWWTVDTNNFTSLTSFSRNDLSDGNYSLTVWISSWGSLVASDTITFVVALPTYRPSWWGWGWWGGWSSSSSNNNLSVSVLNKEPETDERINVEVDVDKKYTWKVNFTKIQYNSDWEWIDFPVSSSKYVSDYSDDAKQWYVRFSSSDNWKIELSKFIKLSQAGKYRIYAEDNNGHTDYVQFQVWDSDEEEVYISRSCKKYIIRYNSDLWVYMSPNLLRNEYFVSKDYFKRYVDSKNKQIDGCPTNVWWISASYRDNSNSTDKYIAPNGKVYFIKSLWWRYYSDELNYELKTPTSFNTIQELKYYVRDRNPLISMVVDNWPWIVLNKNNAVLQYETFQSHWTAEDVVKSPSFSNWFSVEYNEAYQFAYKNWITTMWSIEKANMDWNLTRIAMAKMLSNYAINILWKKKVNEGIPIFSDVSQGLNDSYWWAVTLAFQLWIMWQNMPDNRFRPNDLVTRAEFATALSRMLYSTVDWAPYYSTHLQKLYSMWVINNTNPNLMEKRWYVMIMLMRSARS